jgi:hypothetical protein
MSIHYPHEKSYEKNMKSAVGNYRYFAAKYNTPHTSLVVGNHFWVINDIIREQSLPSCEEYLRSRGRNQALNLLRNNRGRDENNSKSRQIPDSGFRSASGR